MSLRLFRLVVHGHQEDSSSHMPMYRYAGVVRLGPRPSMRTGDAMRCVFPFKVCRVTISGLHALTRSTGLDGRE